MRSILIRITLLSLLVFLFSSGQSQAAKEPRTALVIGNSAYGTAPLKNPVNDATATADKLKELGFTVTLKTNAGERDMDEAIRDFGRKLKKNQGVGLFYYAGHAIQLGGVNYLLPVNARIEKESDVRFNAINADMVLAEMAYAENGLNIIILDACRDNPFTRSFRSVARGLAIISNAPVGTFISYSTGANQVARDGKGEHSPYTEALLENIARPGLTINEVFMNVRVKVREETGQVPWELSSLEGYFYFVPVEPAEKQADARDAMDAANQELKAMLQRLEQEKTALASEMDMAEKRRKQIEAERERLAAEKEAWQQAKEQRSRLEEEKAALASEMEKAEKRRRQIEDEQKHLAAEKEELRKAKEQRTSPTATVAMIVPPAAASVKETARDDRFIAYSNGTVLDTRTNLMWAAKDSGHDVDHYDAIHYCEAYGGGGYTDWRMPTISQLTGLYDPRRGYTVAKSGHTVHLTELIRLSSTRYWALEKEKRRVDCLNFSNGMRFREEEYITLPVLPVRYVK
ncbi:MAG: caspase family protein [Deltaproteobacteria bacterium]|nr:caspase family protein [Deltaproteobacteria bacterium]